MSPPLMNLPPTMERDPLLNAILDSAQDGIIVYDLDLRYQIWNPFMEKLTGVPASEVLGRYAPDIFPFLEEAGVIRNVKRALGGENPGTIDLPHPLPAAGRPGWSSDTCSPLRDTEGRIIGVIAVVREITERKEAEASLRESERLLEKGQEIAGVGSWSWMAEDGSATWSRETYRMLGYDPGEVEVSFEWLLSIMHPDDVEAVGRGIQRSMATGEPYDQEYRLTGKNLQEIIVHSRGEVITDPEGVPIGMVGVIHNVTAQRIAEVEIRTSRNHLRKLATRLETVREEERSALARELHDELGQRLAGLRIDLQWVMDRIPSHPGAVAERLKEMIRLTEETADSVQEISARLRPPMLDLLGLSSTLRWHVEDRLARAGIAVELELSEDPSDLHPDVAVAAFRIVQESVTNVVKHSQAEKVGLTLTAWDRMLVIDLWDDGIGITQEQVTGHRSFGLLGMRERAGRFGGKCEISHRSEGGTRVRAEIPLG